MLLASHSVVSQIGSIIDKLAKQGADESKILNDKLDHLLTLEEERLKIQKEMIELERKKLEVHIYGKFDTICIN